MMLQEQEELTLWTIHARHDFEKMLWQDVITSSWKHCDQHFLPCYEWMQARLSASTQCCSIHPPVWMWFRYSSRSCRPDLRCSGHLPRGKPGVLLTLRLPSSRVLLSQFEMWNWVLNGSYIPWDMRDDENHPHPNPDIIRSSWDKIFDLNYGCPDFWGGEPKARSIQACTPYFHKDEIIQWDYFIAK